MDEKKQDEKKKSFWKLALVTRNIVPYDYDLGKSLMCHPNEVIFVVPAPCTCCSQVLTLRGTGAVNFLLNEDLVFLDELC